MTKQQQAAPNWMSMHTSASLRRIYRELLDRGQDSPEVVNELARRKHAAEDEAEKLLGL